ncbi:hypothetical protein MPSEU_000784100 [Mayamaea pseudoterrestris]|nr:hypothetical protein MPSEU_000784100 [Mayamaea pseudoterrestris]
MASDAAAIFDSLSATFPADDDDDDEDDSDNEDQDEETDAAPAAAPVEDEPPASPTDNEEADPSSSDYHKPITSVPTLDLLYGLRELGREALCWQLSSAKPGNGVEQLLDASLDTYWQSDGNAQPHWIQLHFGRRVAISHVCLYLDFQLDESYTPRKVIVEIGLTQQDFIPACAPVELMDPTGWCIIPLQSPPDPLDDPVHADSHRNLVKTHLIRVSVLSMHQNGRDTHVRHMHLYGPRINTNVLMGTNNQGLAWETSSPAAAAADQSMTPGSAENRRLNRREVGESLGMLQAFSSIR